MNRRADLFEVFGNVNASITLAGCFHLLIVVCCGLHHLLIVVCCGLHYGCIKVGYGGFISCNDVVLFLACSFDGTDANTVRLIPRQIRTFLANGHN